MEGIKLQSRFQREIKTKKADGIFVERYVASLLCFIAQ